MGDWAFITKHAIVLSLIARHPRVTALALSLAIGVTERAIRKVIADLYAADYISKKRMGRGIRYRINPDLPLRHDTHQKVIIGDFLKALGWKRRQRRAPVTKAEGEKPPTR